MSIAGPPSPETSQRGRESLCDRQEENVEVGESAVRLSLGGFSSGKSGS